MCRATAPTIPAATSSRRATPRCHKGITINGIVILSDQPLPWNPEHTHPPGGLAKYYQDNVIGGPGAFVMAAENFDSFGKAMIGKMIAEVAMVPVEPSGLKLTARAASRSLPQPVRRDMTVFDWFAFSRTRSIKRSRLLQRFPDYLPLRTFLRY